MPDLLRVDTTGCAESCAPPANTTSLIMLSEVVFASLSAMLLGAGELTTRTLIGGGLIVLATLLAAGLSQAA